MTTHPLTPHHSPMTTYLTGGFLPLFLPLVELVVERLEDDPQLAGGGLLVAVVLGQHPQDVVHLDFLERLRRRVRRQARHRHGRRLREAERYRGGDLAEV